MKNLFLYLAFLLPLCATSQQRVGIGTTTPLAKLDIQSIGDGAELLRFTTDRPWVFKQSATGVNTRLTLQSSINDKKFDILSENGLNRAAVFHSNNTFSNVLLVPDAGEVGVGIEDPLGKLHIVHDSNLNWPNLRITESNSDFARIKLETQTQPSTYWDIAGRSDSLTENSRLNFFFYSPNGWGDRMTIRGNGKIGIGNVNPEARLDIVGGDWNLEGGQPGDLRVGNSTHNLRIGVATGGGGAGITRIFAGGGANELRLGTSNETRLTISDDGNVGIGTPTPGNLLRVNGKTNSTQHVFSSSSNYSGNVDVRAVEGFSTPADGYGYGGYFVGGYHGVLAQNNAGGYGGTSYGVRGNSTGSAGTRIGVHGSATGGSTNWAGFFDNGNVFVRNDVRIGSGAQSGVTGYKVVIDGKMLAEEVRIQNSTAWPDYVFEENYQLPGIEAVADHIKQNKHLPGIPSASEVATNGRALGDMQVKMMEKIEELTLYIIDLNDRNNALQERVQQLESQLKK